ncbi:TMV resistance protein N-like [Pyrus ussuriensis x Pyrus communis]|uniref:TMV resistance protein N-like n=1 Tax=Pyrus ussuriensis x Pyrus communis TaxID=2448454 RepID=A0A5N5FHD7_9ROSA|nr:TMV resistance protein N-like [Pyrus ussuriensis x Pyrus communis]
MSFPPSRDRRTLRPTVEEDMIYEVEGLKPDDALRLFCSHAFKNNTTPKTNYKGLAEKALDYAGGIPLALVLLGSSFLNCKSKEEWEDELNKLKEFPNENIHKVLRQSYDGLGRNEKEIFLDIACFHKGKDVDEVKRMFDIRTPIVQAILVRSYKIEEQKWKRADFKVMSNLMMLIVVNSRMVDAYCKLTSSLDLPNSLRYLRWEGYPLKSLLSSFSPENLVELHMPGSRVKKLWNEEQRLVNLKLINLKWFVNLTEVPNLSGSREIVHIILGGCVSLVEIPGCFQHLDKFTHLDLAYCKSLKYLLKMPENIEILDLHHNGIQELLESIWKLPSNMCKLKVSGCFDLQCCTSLGKVSELPRDISELSLVGCKRLVSLPTDICKLKSLKTLNIYDCSKLENFPEILEPMEHLNFLSLKGTVVEKLPSSIGNVIGLETLDLGTCRNLSVVPSSIYCLTNLKTLRFRYYLLGTRISEIPDGLVGSTSLQDLDLTGSLISSIPASIKQASRLHRLSLIRCEKLQSLPELPVQCDLKAKGCTSLKTVSSSRTALTQGWDKYTYFGNRNFFNCQKLDHNARSNMMDEAQHRILRVATNSSNKSYGNPWFVIVCPGKEIPKWFSFSYQNEGSSVHIKLPPDFFRTGFSGFAFSIVVSCVSNCDKEFVISNFKSLGESHGLFDSAISVGRYGWRLNDCSEMCSPNVYKLANEASEGEGEKMWHMPVVWEDVDRVFISGEPKIQEETREDETWEASGSSYKNKANESDDESELRSQ